MSLPLYRLVINDEDHTGVTAVALVDDPAIQINWQAFQNHKPLRFQTISAEKRIIAGPLMVADMQIYRNDEKRGEYFVYFDRQTITQIRDKFHRNQYEHNVNPMHESMLLLPDMYMIEDWEIDRARGKNPPVGFEMLSDGSWYGEIKVRNDEVWNEYVKTGVFKGFSVEGFFNEELVRDLSDQEIEAIVAALQVPG